MKVVSNINAANTMLAKRGLQKGGRVQKMFTSECARQMDPYVPMSSGLLKNTRIIGDDYVVYNMPYAGYQYYGKVMIGVKSHSPWAKEGEPKVVTNRDLTYQGAPMRGPFWDRRMWRDKQGVIIAGVTAKLGG